MNGTFIGKGTGYKKAAAEAAAAEDTARKLSWAPAFRCKLIFVFLIVETDLSLEMMWAGVLHTHILILILQLICNDLRWIILDVCSKNMILIINWVE